MAKKNCGRYGCSNKLTFDRQRIPTIPWPATEAFGNLINDTFTSLSDWTETSPDTAFSVSGGDLLINKSVGGGYNFNDYLAQTAYGGSCIDNWTITVPFKLTEISASATGFAVGVRSTATWYSNLHNIVQFNTNSGAGGKKLYFYMGGATSATTTSASALTCAVNDECTLVVTMTGDTTNGYRITATATNLTNPNSISHSYTFIGTYPTTIGIPPTSYFSIYALPGTVTLHSYTVSTALLKNINIAAIGDSITAWLYAGTYGGRWFNQAVLGSTKTNYAMGGPGDRTETVLHRIPQITAFNPNYIILAIGGNDLEGGVAIGTVQTRYQSIVTQLTKAGRTIYHCKPTPRNAYNFATWNAWLDSNFTNVIDTNTQLLGTGYTLAATYNATDNVHINLAGHTLVGSIVRTAILSKL